MNTSATRRTMRHERKMRRMRLLRNRLLATAAAITLVLSGGLITASSASATHPTLSGVGDCAPGDITWTIGGDTNHPKGDLVEQTAKVTVKKCEVPFDNNWQFTLNCDGITIPFPANLPAGQSGVMEVNFRFSQNGKETTVNYKLEGYPVLSKYSSLYEEGSWMVP